MKVDIKVPAVGESITEATIGEWTKKSGEYVKRDDIILMLETDKASVEVVAPSDGVLTTKVDAGATVPIDTVVAQIDTEGVAAQPSPAASPTAEVRTPPPAPAAAAPGPQAHPELQAHLSPATRRAVAETGVEPSTIQGTGRGGRLTKADVEAAAKTRPMTPPPSANGAAKAAPVTPPLPEKAKVRVPGQTRRVPMTTIRKRIAERLVQAQHTAAILTTFNEADMSAINELRAKYKDKFKERYGISLGMMGFFVKACIEALKDIPEVNASIEGNDIVYKDFYNIGVAVGTEKGLVVPVVRDADQMSLAEIEMAIRHYAIKARDGKISIDDLSGGTFTVSNGGVYGSLLSTPILNPPQSGILGMHKVEDRPIVINGKVEVRPMMYLALSYDHRIIDGKEAVTFLVKVKECLEDPSRILLEI